MPTTHTMELTDPERNIVLEYRARRHETLIAMTKRHLRDVYKVPADAAMVIDKSLPSEDVYITVAVDTASGVVNICAELDYYDNVRVIFQSVQMTPDHKILVARQMLMGD